MRVVDTNVLLYAANSDSEFHELCRSFLETLRLDSVPSYLTWNICYEFLRVSTHARVFRSPWRSAFAWSFLQNLLASPGFGMLLETNRHPAALEQTLSELPEVRGNLLHDLHTVAIMREHGISRICTRDSDFSRFPSITVIDPVSGIGVQER